MKLRDMDKNMELGKVIMLPLIAILECHNTAVVVTVPEAFRLHFLQLKSVMQKSYVALWSECTFLENPSMIQILDEQKVE